METKNNKLLVPIDFSNTAIWGLDFSYELAKISNAELCLLHVIKDSGPFWNIFSEKEQKNYKMLVKEKLENLAETIKSKHKLKVTTYIKTGNVIEKILETADELNPKMIVLGTTGADDITKKIIGSNALRIIKEAKCPVITIKNKKERPGCKNIVLPLDMTKETKEKVGYATYLAKYFKAKIWIISAFSTTDKYLKERYRLQLEQVQEHLTAQGIDCEIKIIKTKSSGTSSITKAILDFSYSVKADLIMIMTQQEPTFLEYFISSSATEIIHHSEIPVMSIVPRVTKKRK